MLEEVPRTRQHPGEARRRWFTCLEQDLYVWQDPEGNILAFELCYAKLQEEHALLWRKTAGFAHLAIDGGGSGISPQTPIARMDGAFASAAVSQRFLQLSAALPQDIVHFVIARLLEYPQPPREQTA